MQAINCAAGDSAEDVWLPLDLRHLDSAGSKWLLYFGNEHLRNEECAGRGHDHCGEQILGVGATYSNVSGHHPPGDVGHSAGHNRHQFGLRELRKEWTDRQGRLSLAHENTGSDVERFSTAGCHHFCHDPSASANDDLHDTDVIENSKKGSYKDNCRQDLKGKDESERGLLLSQFTEHENGTVVGKIEEMLGPVASL